MIGDHLGRLVATNIFLLEPPLEVRPATLQPGHLFPNMSLVVAAVVLLLMMVVVVAVVIVVKTNIYYLHREYDDEKYYSKIDPSEVDRRPVYSLGT